METDDVDIEFEIKKTKKQTPSHSRNNSSVSPMAPLNRIPESVELTKTGSGIMEELADEMKKMKSTESENESIPDPITMKDDQWTMSIELSDVYDDVDDEDVQPELYERRI